MSAFGAKIQTFIDAFAAAYPERVVVRSYEDIGVRSDAEFKKGVFTAIIKGADRLDDERNRSADTGDLSFIFIGQIKLNEKATGEEIEEAELTLLDEVDDFLDSNPAGLCAIDLINFTLSQQIERPYGWVAIQMRWSDF